MDRGKIGQKVSVEGQPEGFQTLGGPLKSRLCFQLVSLGLFIFFTSLHFFFFFFTVVGSKLLGIWDTGDT